MIQLLILTGLIILGYTTGSVIEKNHYASIEEREKQKAHQPVLNVSKPVDSQSVIQSKMVIGSAVISIDYFKRFIAQLINLVGGEVVSYETLVDRARREAILRMKDQAFGYDYILNLRLDTSTIGNTANQKNGMGSVEVLAYGTAVKVKKKTNDE